MTCARRSKNSVRAPRGMARMARMPKPLSLVLQEADDIAFAKAVDAAAANLNWSGSPERPAAGTPGWIEHMAREQGWEAKVKKPEPGAVRVTSRSCAQRGALAPLRNSPEVQHLPRDRLQVYPEAVQHLSHPRHARHVQRPDCRVNLARNHLAAFVVGEARPPATERRQEGKVIDRGGHRSRLPHGAVVVMLSHHVARASRMPRFAALIDASIAVACRAERPYSLG